MFGSKKTCRVLRVDQFLKGISFMDKDQKNKFSIICEDGSVCRAEDTGFAAIKPGDVIEFKGYPEFGRIEEFGKCDHAQLIRVIPQEGQPAAQMTPAEPSMALPTPANGN